MESAVTRPAYAVTNAGGGGLFLGIRMVLGFGEEVDMIGGGGGWLVVIMGNTLCTNISMHDRCIILFFPPLFSFFSL